MSRVEAGPVPAGVWACLCNECGAVAFLYAKKPVAGEMLESKYVRDLHGNQIQPRSPVRCLTCGALARRTPRVDEMVPYQ